MRSANSLLAALTDDWRQGGFGLYVHWPFCAAKCPYCDFNSHVSREIDHRRWKNAYLTEIKRVSMETPGRVLTSVFFGGGTPSLMDPDTVDAILSAVRAAWPLANDCEITLEANPGSVDSGRFRAFAESGVNRVSVGVQALNDADLRQLGRIHSVAEARAAIDVARTHFDRVSFDLIYARQNQTLADWGRELAEALSFAPDHLSLYQLTVEDGTVFGDRQQRGTLRGLPDEALAEALFIRTQEMTEAAGFEAYEVSNHARNGSQSRHNLIYWRSGDFAGIGPGAHGRLTLSGRRLATEALRMPTAWLEAAERGQGAEIREQVDPIAQAEECLMMGLRISEGIDPDRLRDLCGQAPDAERVRFLQEQGLLHEGPRLRATQRGRLVLNALIADLARVF
jgi:putative oxygen-independent coproporphyrinogen III oxidase